MIALLAAGFLAASSAPPPRAQSTAACPRSHVRIVDYVLPTFPDGAHPTSSQVSFLIDLGSDGRIRRIAKAESSGDPAVDDATAKAIAQFRFAAPTYGCMAASTVAQQGWTVPPAALESPPAEATASASPSPCPAPFVYPLALRVPPRRAVPGTATVDISLDAALRVTGVQLVRSSGNVKTNYAATIAARTGRYAFRPLPGCPPVATTYRLELTFR